MIVILLRVLYYCIISFIVIVWVSGCSNKSSNNIVRVSNFGSVKFRECNSELHCMQWERDVLVNNSSSLNLLNKGHITDNIGRYDYNYISKGSYSSSCYKVRPGDTLFYIAWITDIDYRILAKRNNIEVNSILKVGQILQVDVNKKALNNQLKIRNMRSDTIKKELNTSSVLKRCTLDSVNCSDKHDSNESCFLNKKSISLLSSSHPVVYDINNKSDSSKIVSDKLTTKLEKRNIQHNVKESSVCWVWPTDGTIVGYFSSSEGGNRGIDISGIEGQSIFSASSGKVVYAGDALFGYGNLIIIKHNNDFLSTYAHNEKILVSEQQNVFLGQKIATMGSSGSDAIKLHFEIRYRGKSVDPLFYLPKR